MSLLGDDKLVVWKTLEKVESLDDVRWVQKELDLKRKAIERLLPKKPGFLENLAKSVEKMK